MVEDNTNNNTIQLELSDMIQKEGIVTSFGIDRIARCIILELNHKYDHKTIISTINRKNWDQMIKSFSERARKKRDSG